MKKRKHQEFFVVLFLFLLESSQASVATSVTSVTILSGETAALTCTVSADAGETLTTKQWKDANNNIIGNAAGTFTTDSVTYTITELSLTGNQIVNWKIETSSVTVDIDSLACFRLTDSSGFEKQGLIDVVSVTPLSNGIVTGGTSAVSCTLSGLASGSSATVGWSQAGTSISNGGSYSLTTSTSGADTIAILTASTITSDQTFTCTFTSSAGGSVSSTVDLDHVTITTNSEQLISGNSANLNCVLTDASLTAVDKKWFDGSSTELTVADGNPYVFYESPPNTWLLTVASVTQSTTFTCCFQFVAGTCINTNAQVDIISFTLTATDYIVESGTNLDISCVVTDATSQPTTIEWSNSGGNIASGFVNGNYAGNSQTTTLTLTGIATDTVYTCKFIIPAGGSDVTLTETISVDTVNLTPTDGTALSGSSVIVSCQIVGAALKPTVVWKDAGSSVSGAVDDPWAADTGTFLSKLTVSGLSSTKTYTCEYTVNSNVISKTAVANILSITPVGVTTDTGGAATITCNMANSPTQPSNVFWKDSSSATVAMSNGFSKTEGAWSGGGGTQSAELVLGTSTISADTSYTCVFIVGASSYEMAVPVDHITITTADTSKLSANSATVSCVLAGAGSMPTIGWFSSSTEITDTNRLTVPVSLTSEGLTTSLVSSSDTTDISYTCRFTFSSGTLEKVAIVDVVTVTATDDVVQSGGTATITCALAGSQFAPSANAWYLNDVEKPTGGDYIADKGSYDSNGDTQVMKLQKASVSALETYRCSFTINGERIDGSARIICLTVTAPSYMITVNSGVAISCAVVGADSDPTVTWKTSSGAINSGTSETPFQGGDGSKTATLTLASLSTDTTYTCDFTMGAEVVSESIDVDTVILTPTAGTALLGDSVIVTCEISGAGAEPTVTWKDAGSAVTGGTVNNDPWVSQGGTLLSKLTVTGVTSTKAFTCFFDVGGNEVSAVATANIVSIAEVGTTVYTGSTSSISCTLSNAQADPDLISWKNSDDDSLVSGVNGYTITNNNFNSGSRESVLTLNTNLISGDTSFTCIFIVEGTSVQKIVSVDHVSITPSSFTKLSADSGTVSCVLAGAGSMPNIGWFSSSTEITDTNRLTVPVSLTSEGLTTSLVSSSDTTDTTYTCRFTFSSGTLEKVAIVDVVTVTATDDVVQSGGTATITCALAGSQFAPSANAWYLNDVEKPTGGDYIADKGSYDSNGDTQVMKLQKASVSALETYRCSFTINGERIDGSARIICLTVTAPSYMITVNSGVAISCAVVGADSDPTVTWKTSSGAINSGTSETPFQGGDGSKTATLTLASLSTDTTYTCDFTMGAEVVSESIDVDTVILTPTAGTALLGDSVIVTCEISGAGAEPTVTWKDAGSAVTGGTVNNDPWVSQGGTLLSKLTVTGVTSTKAFTCFFDVGGNEVSAVATANIVSIAEVGTTVYTGSTSSISCTLSNAQADPDLISWKNSDDDSLVSGVNGYTITNNNFNSGSRESVLTLNTNLISGDTSFTCRFVVEGTSVQKIVSVDHVSITPSSFTKLAADSATVSCVLAGAGSMPTIGWFSSSTEITDTNRLTVPVSLTSEGLTTSLVSTSDTTDTTFTCRFTFTNAVLSQPMTVDVVTVTPVDNIVASGGTATISCTLAGSQLPTSLTVWTLNSVEKTTGGEYNVDVGTYNNQADTHLMTLERSNAQNPETYTCAFTVSGNTVESTVKTIIFGTTSVSDTIKAGETATLSCSITGVVVQPTVAWTNGVGGSISTGGANTISPDSWSSNALSTELEVTGLTADSSYTCTFTLSDGSTTAEALTVDFVSIAVSTSTETVVSGSTVTLTCFLSGSNTTPGTPVWNDGSNDLSDDASNTIMPGSFADGTQTSSLTVASLTQDTTYTCSFTLSSVTVTENLAVDVLSISVPAVIIAPGEVATLTCTVNDIGTAVTIAWTGYNSGITAGALQGSTQNSKLEVSYLYLDTTFTCSVTRGTFATTATAQVTVLDTCAKGSYYLTSGGSTTCTPCAIGSYTNNPYLRSCSACPNSGTTFFAGSSSSNQCYSKTADHSVVMKTGDSVTLTASITVSDTVSGAVWTSDNGGTVIAPDTESSSFSTLTSTLVVSSWAAQVFTCTFSVTRAGESNPATTTVIITALTAAIIDQPVATAQSPASSYSLTCSGDLPASGLAVESGWVKDGEQVDILMTTAQATLSDKVTSTLTMGYLTSDMTGSYSCYFKYALSASLPTSTYKINSDTTYLAIEGISMVPKLSGGLMGSSATITCLGVSSADALSVEWKINGSPVATTNSITNTYTTVSASKESKSVLEMSSLSTAEEGSIGCFMLFDNTWFSGSGTVNVIAVVENPHRVDAFKGAATEMHCVVEGLLTPTIEWYKGTVKVDDSLSSITYTSSKDYRSSLTITSVSASDDGQYKCKATWPSDTGTTGGSAESAEARLSVHGVNFITENTEVAQNSVLKIHCRVDDFETPAIIWKKDGLVVTGDGIQRYDTDSWYDTITATTSSLGSFQYTCAAKYTHASGAISYTGTESTTLTVYKICSTLSDPTGGAVVCTGSVEDKTCTVTCNTNYVPRATPRTFTCTDGTWDLLPSDTECTAKSTPSSYRLTYTAVYNYPIPCLTSWGPFILAAYPYQMGNAASSLTEVPAVVQMDATSFQCINNPTDCTSSSDCQQIKIKFQYVQTGSLANDDPLQTTRSEISSYTSSNSLDVSGLLSAAGRLDSNGNLQGSYSGKKKRSAEKYKGTGFVMDPASKDAESSLETVQCPEFTIMVDGHCTMCGHGWFIKDNDCSPCPHGTYQTEEDSNKCHPCPDGLSTLVTAATSQLMCVEVCKVKQPLHGVVHPKEGTMLTSPSDVTVICEEGFSLENGNRHDEVSCDEQVHCSRIQLVDVPEFIIRETDLTVNCVIEADYSFENCTLIQNGAAVQSTSTFYDNNRQICSFYVTLTSSTEVSCSAESPEIQLIGDMIEVTMLKPTVKANSQTFLTSDSMNLACSALVPSRHSVLMRWKKHGDVIGTPTISHNNLGLLVHSNDNVQFHDSGEYSCEVEYLGIGFSESEVIPVTVGGFLEELGDFSMYEGHGVKISCVLPTGRFASFMSWYRDGEKQPNQGTEIEGLELQMISSDFVIGYPGTYECRGVASGLPYSSVAVIKSNKDYGFLFHPEPHYIVEGGYATFSCRFSDVSVPIQWLLDGSPMGEEQNDRASLRLASLQNDKEVQCVATLPSGEQIFSKKAKAVVRRFITKPSDTVLGDEDATFHCSVYGPSIKDISWVTEYGGVAQSSSTSQLTAVELHATFKVSSSNKVRCVATFLDGDRLISPWVETLTYEVSVSDRFVFFRRGFLAKCQIHSDEAPSAVFWKMSRDVLYEDSDVIYDGYQGYSESSYYLTSLTDAQVADLSCTAVFRGSSITVTSPQKSIAPLGITSHPHDTSLVQDTVKEVDVSCEFYDYPEVHATVTWSTDSLMKLGATTVYVKENIARSTVRVQIQEDGQYIVSCSVQYPDYGTVVSDPAFVSVLQPISVETASKLVGYGEIAEVRGMIPVSGSYEPGYQWSVNGVFVNQQDTFFNQTYITSELRWPLMQDSTITLTTFSKGKISRESVFIEVYGIRSMKVEGRVEMGSSADLVCMIEGNVPPSEVFWYFNTERHDPTFSHQSDTTTKSVFSLNNIEPSHFGHYTCVAGYPDRPSVFQRMPVVPLGSCALPQVFNGGFSSNFVSEGSSATVTCNPSYTAPEDYGTLSCRDGVLEGRTPVCVQVLRHTDDTSAALLVILVACACVVMTCSVVLSFVIWYKKHNKVIFPDSYKVLYYHCRLITY